MIARRIRFIRQCSLSLVNRNKILALIQFSFKKILPVQTSRCFSIAHKSLVSNIQITNTKQNRYNSFQKKKV